LVIVKFGLYILLYIKKHLSFLQSIQYYCKICRDKLKNKIFCLVLKNIMFEKNFYIVNFSQRVFGTWETRSEVLKNGPTVLYRSSPAFLLI